MPDSPLMKRLLKYLETLPVVDCHSHTMNPEDYVKHEPGLFTFWSYFGRDSGGILGDDVSKRISELPDDRARWRLLSEILDKARNVTYWRHHVIMYRELFGLKDWELTDRNWRALSDRIKRTAGTSKWYDEVTRRKCGLVTAVRNVTPFDEKWDPKYFTPVVRMECVLRLHTNPAHTPGKPDRIERRGRSRKTVGIQFVEKGLDLSIDNLNDLKTAIASLVSRYKDRGAVGVKFGHAYWRTLYHEKIADRQASPILGKLLRGRSISDPEIKALQDWGFRQTVAAAGDLGMVVQIHTGVQTNWGHIPDSNPLNLLNVLNEFRNVRFDLFHAGYPYAREMGMLGKHYPNVWLNMCWMYLVTTAGSRQLLSEWIDLVPGHRLLGFGSDVVAPEFIYGHLVMARDCLARVLAEKVERDYMTEEGARTLARMMLLENPCKLYGLKEPRA